jgi:hypothetical protein
VASRRSVWCAIEHVRGVGRVTQIASSGDQSSFRSPVRRAKPLEIRARELRRTRNPPRRSSHVVIRMEGDRTHRKPPRRSGPVVIRMEEDRPLRKPPRRSGPGARCAPRRSRRSPDCGACVARVPGSPRPLPTPPTHHGLDPPQPPPSFPAVTRESLARCSRAGGGSDRWVTAATGATVSRSPDRRYNT